MNNYLDLRTGAGFVAALALVIGGVGACAMDGDDESYFAGQLGGTSAAMADLDCMVTLSRQSFSDPDGRQSAPCQGHIYQPNSAYSNNVLASYLKTDTPNVVRVAFAFRGSASVGDWIRNLQSQIELRRLNAVSEFPAREAQSGDYANARVGMGWDERWVNQAGLMLALLERARADYPDRHLQIYLTGHSLGGVMATRAALDVSVSAWQVDTTVRVYAWNPPRLGDDEAAKVMQAAIVPCLTEASECFEYRQFTRKRDVVHGLPANLSLDNIRDPWSHAVWQKKLKPTTGRPLKRDIGYCPHFHAPKVKGVGAHDLDIWREQLADREVFTDEWLDCMLNPRPAS
ncbi:MAG: hypothetical protein AAGC55_27835 [Myxococcota bacterium]